MNYGVHWKSIAAASCFLFACGGAQSSEPAAPGSVAAITLPSQTPPTPSSLPPPIETVETPRRDMPSEMFVTVSFVEARKHPSAARVDAVLRGAPAWHAFPTIDPVRDLDWLVLHDDDIIAWHNAPEARVDAAIAAVAGPATVSVPNVKAWRGVVNGFDTEFLRATPQVVRIARARNAMSAARDLVAHPPTTPSFHANEALRLRVVNPAALTPKAPRDISEARVWVDSRIADAGADIYAEADCPDEAAATADAAAISDLVRRENTFGVRIATAGLFNAVEITTVGRQVHVHIRASQQQIESTLYIVAATFGRP